MAYAALISLKHTIEHLQNSSHISLVPPSPQIIEFAHKELTSLQETLIRLDWNSRSRSRKSVNALDGEIRGAVCKLEDVIESHVTKQILSQSEEGADNGDGIQFSIDLKDLRRHIYSFVGGVKKMEQKYNSELCNPLPDEEDEVLSSRIDFGGKTSKMVGLSDKLIEMKDQLIRSSAFRWDSGFRAIPLVGMAGIGKTTLAREIFKDPDILEHFDCRAWVTVGSKCQVNEIQRGILAQLCPHTDKMLIEGDVAYDLEKSLRARRCLIVLDDVWDTQDWSDFKRLFSQDNEGGRVLLTTRLKKVAQHVQDRYVGVVTMRLMNKEESWDLLREKVFAEQLCPHELEKAGKKIAEKCEGLPLTIVTVADQLSKAKNTTPEYWNKVAENQNSVFKDAYERISEVLSSSYEYLPQHLKACFFYMGVFPEKYEILTSKLINMWIAEGYLEPNKFQTSESFAIKSLYELDSYGLVMVDQNCTLSTNGIKSCGLHSSVWHLCNKEAVKNKFLYVLNNHSDCKADGIKSQRRLCIHNNVLLGFKDVSNSMEVNCASTARSLICCGPYHQYPVSISFGLRLLRMLDALTIRLYEFPIEVLKLVQLIYLALTCNVPLPSSISKLWNLRFLIVRQHLSIKSCEASSYLPMEIWAMKGLKHLQIMGSDLPSPIHGALLPNLLTLSNVSGHNCTQRILERIPNLKKLGFHIELAPHIANPLRCLDYISHLSKLESIKCVIVNPELMSRVVAPPAKFPSNLRKLHLSGLGYPWECMSIIDSLPNLEVLKLRNYAFRGPKWETETCRFERLSFLLIEDTDLVQWKVGYGCFRNLERLSIKHCYNLQELHWEPEIYSVEIEVVDCNHLVVTCANQIREATYRKGDIHVLSSWNDGNLET